jgi:hypothetical protein
VRSAFVLLRLPGIYVFIVSTRCRKKKPRAWHYSTLSLYCRGRIIRGSFGYTTADAKMLRVCFFRILQSCWQWFILIVWKLCPDEGVCTAVYISPLPSISWACAALVHAAPFCGSSWLAGFLSSWCLAWGWCSCCCLPPSSERGLGSCASFLFFVAGGFHSFLCN